MSYTIKNNFEGLKKEFQKETGLDPKTNIEVYIQYYQARMIDTQMQIQASILNELVNWK